MKHLKRILGGFGLFCITGFFIGLLILLVEGGAWLWYNSAWAFFIPIGIGVCYLIGWLLKAEDGI